MTDRDRAAQAIREKAGLSAGAWDRLDRIAAAGWYVGVIDNLDDGVWLDAESPCKKKRVFRPLSAADEPVLASILDGLHAPD